MTEAMFFFVSLFLFASGVFISPFKKTSSTTTTTKPKKKMTEASASLCLLLNDLLVTALQRLKNLN